MRTGAAGVEFIAENGGEPGVRFQKARRVAYQTKWLSHGKSVAHKKPMANQLSSLGLVAHGRLVPEKSLTSVTIRKVCKNTRSSINRADR